MTTPIKRGLFSNLPVSEEFKYDQNEGIAVPRYSLIKRQKELADKVGVPFYPVKAEMDLGVIFMTPIRRQILEFIDEAVKRMEAEQNQAKIDPFTGHYRSNDIDYNSGIGKAIQILRDLAQ